MGRHSLPDPGESSDGPSDEDSDEHSDEYDSTAEDSGGEPAGRHGAVQHGETQEPAEADETAATDDATAARPEAVERSAWRAPRPPAAPREHDYLGQYDEVADGEDVDHGDDLVDRDDVDEDDDVDDGDDFADGPGYLDEGGSPASAAYPRRPDYPEYPDYPDFPAREGYPEPPVAGADAVPPVFRGGGHRGLEDGGGHRSAVGRRGVSIGVIVALVAVVVLVGGVILYRFFGDVLSHRSHTAAARCVGGKDAVAVIADPSIADSVKQFADSYNAAAGPVGDKCVSVTVKAATSDAVVGGFVGKWPADLGNQPGLWIPGSSISAARLAGAAGKQSISDSRSLATSPVVLAVRPELQQALANQGWAALPGLQTNPTSMAGLNLPTWGSLRLALPLSGNADAGFLAGEAVAAASAPAGAPPTAGSGAIRTLLSGQPKLPDGSLNQAMDSLLNATDPAAAPVHAVITTEQQLFQRGQSLPDAKAKLASWLPPGAVPVADYPTVLLAGSWLSQEEATAASEFAQYMHKPEQLEKLAKAGFRVKDVKPPSSPVTTFPALPSTLSVGDEGTRATLADAMAAPSAGVAVTIMLDQSLPVDDGGKTRLANVIAALQGRIKALPPTAVVGLWTFDGHEGRSEVPLGVLADPVGGQPRSAALSSALDKQFSSNGGAVSFTTLRMLYQDMQTNYHAGQANSILVITAGPHTDQSLDGAGLQEFVRKSADPARPVAVNVIDFGSDPDRATWEAVAQLSGGGYQNLGSSASPDLATAVNNFLS